MTWLKNLLPGSSGAKSSSGASGPTRKVIRGWDEGVMTMKIGGRRQLKVPSALGYGAVGSPPVIPKNATLILAVELLEVA